MQLIQPRPTPIADPIVVRRALVEAAHVLQGEIQPAARIKSSRDGVEDGLWLRLQSASGSLIAALDGAAQLVYDRPEYVAQVSALTSRVRRFAVNALSNPNDVPYSLAERSAFTDALKGAIIGSTVVASWLA
jgi:hypothetical protein